MPASKTPPTPAKPGAASPGTAKPATATAKPAASPAKPATAAPKPAAAPAKPATAATRLAGAPATGAAKPAPATGAKPAAPARPAERSALLSKPGAAVQSPKGGPVPPKSEKSTSKQRRLKLPAANRRIGNENAFWSAMGMSVLAHVALIGFFGLLVLLPAFKPSRFHDKGLDVVLVNAKHARAPNDPQALAQANLDGGGNSDDKVRASTPLPPQEQTQEGDALLEQHQRVEQLETANRQLLSQAKNLKAPQIDTPPPQENAPVPPKTNGLDLYDNARAAIKLEAEIDREHREYAARPRKAFVGARTSEVVYAQYVEDWRQKVERVGTLNFPHSAQGKLYGSLLLVLEVRADGSIANMEVRRSSGNSVLDAAAMRIVSLASPYAEFTPEMRKKTDILVISRTWTFTRSDTLEARKGE